MATFPIVKLSPITRAAKNTLREHGEIFRVIDESSTVLFTTRPGPWLLLESMKDVDAGKGLWSFAMWVAESGDADYRVVGRQESEGQPAAQDDGFEVDLEYVLAKNRDLHQHMAGSDKSR